MTDMNHTFRSLTPQYDDTFGIGQKTIARIRLDIARKDLAECARVIIDPVDMWEDYRAAHVRMFHDARARAAQALSVLEGGAQ